MTRSTTSQTTSRTTSRTTNRTTPRLSAVCNALDGLPPPVCAIIDAYAAHAQPKERIASILQCISECSWGLVDASGTRPCFYLEPFSCIIDVAFNGEEISAAWVGNRPQDSMLYGRFALGTSSELMAVADKIHPALAGAVREDPNSICLLQCEMWGIWFAIVLAVPDGWTADSYWPLIGHERGLFLWQILVEKSPLCGFMIRQKHDQD